MLRIFVKRNAVEGSSRLYEQWGEQASWREEHEELREALGGERDLELSRFAVSWTVDMANPSFTINYHYKNCGIMQIPKGLCSPVVSLSSRKEIPHIALSFLSLCLCFHTYTDV